MSKHSHTEALNLLSDDEIHAISTALHEQDLNAIAPLLQEFSTADTAELLGKLNEEDRQSFISFYGDKLSPEVFPDLDQELRRHALSSMSAQEVAGILSSLESDDALELIHNLDDDFQKEIIRNLSAKTRLTLEEGLSFPEDSAGRLMQREVVAVPDFWTAGKTIDYLRAATADLPGEFFDIFVVDPAHHLAGQIPLSRLVRAARAEKIENLTLDETHPLPADLDQEEVAHIFRRDDIVSAPVVDENNRLLGVITVDDIVDVIDEEAQEDLLKLAGVNQGDLYRAVLSTTGTRFRWLFVNLLTAILASIVISFFDAEMTEIVALAILMPIVASMGGNAGTQALTVAVRALATRELSGANSRELIFKESIVGTLNGAIFAIIIGLVAALWFNNPMLGVVIALAMTINLFVAGLFGASIPVILNRMGSDPAVSSTVFLTTITDVVGFLAFLGLGAVFLF